MGGVDRANQKRKYYHISRKNNRWWTYMACYLIDIALVNAFERFKFTVTKKVKDGHKAFNMAVAKELIGGFTHRINESVREVASSVRKSTKLRCERHFWTYTRCVAWPPKDMQAVSGDWQRKK